MVETRGRKRKNDDQEIKEKRAKRKGNAKRKAKKTRKTTMEETMAEETTAVEETTGEETTAVEETTGEETTAVETTSDVAEAPVEANEVDEEDTEDKEDGDEENEVDDGEENSDGGDEDNEIEDGDGEEKSDGDEENEDNDGEEKSDGSDEDNDGEGKSDGSDEEEEGEESEEEVGAIGEENANEENGNEEIANPNEEIHNNEDIGNIANEQGGRPAEEVTDETEAIKPTRMFFKPSEYNKKIKLSTRCFIVDAVTTLKNLKPKLSNAEWNWFVEHPQFRHIFHMKRENHRVQGMWMLLLRTTGSCKMREVWFVVNGTPIWYGLREHALISGLNCHNYPLGYKELGGTKFMDRHFKEGEPRRLEDVKAKLLNMGPHRDRLKMAVLFFLASVICGQTKVGNGANDVLEFFQRAVDDLELCRTFPWGRFSFDYMLKEIAHTMAHFGGLVKENALWPLPGFCVPLELLAFEAIPSMGKQFRQPVEGVDVYCPRMCRSSFKRNGMTGISLSEINKALGEETVSMVEF